MKKGLVLFAALGLIALFAIPVLAQEAAKPLEEQVMELQEKMSMMPAVPNIGVSGNAQVSLTDGNFNSKVDAEGFHFATGDVNATIEFKGSADGTGVLAGTKTSASLKIKFNPVDSGLISDSATSDFPNADKSIIEIVQDGAWLKIAGIAGMLDLTGYPFDSDTGDGILNPVLTEKPGIGLDVNLGGGIAIKTKFASQKSSAITYVQSSGAKDDPTLFAGAVTAVVPIPDLITISAGLAFTQAAPVIIDTTASPAATSTQAKDKVFNLGVGAKADVKAVPNLSLPVSFGLKMINKFDPDSTAAAGAAKATSGIKVDAPITYTLGDLKAKAGVSFATYDYVQEEVLSTNATTGFDTQSELKVTAGAEYGLPDLGITAKLDATIYPMVSAKKNKAAGSKWIVDPNDKNDDYGAYSGNNVTIEEANPGLVLKIVPAVDIKTGIVTTTLSLTFHNDPNVTKADKDIGDDSRLGVTIKWAAGF
jgi:hypothetical protein